MAMKDGLIKIDIKDGKIVKISTNSNLSIVFERIFRKELKRSLKSDNLENSVKIITFGSFWLETKTNEVLRLIVGHEINTTKFRDAVWDSIKTEKTINKLEILSVFANKSLLKSHSSLKPKIRRVLDSRNRLAHFKDQDSPIALGEFNLLEMFYQIAIAPDPQLSKELRQPQIGKHISTILDEINWLNKLHDDYCIKNNIPLPTSQKIKSGRTTYIGIKGLFQIIANEEPEAVSIAFIVEATKRERTPECYRAASDVLRDMGTAASLKALKTLQGEKKDS